MPSDFILFHFCPVGFEIERKQYVIYDMWVGIIDGRVCKLNGY